MDKKKEKPKPGMPRRSALKVLGGVPAVLAAGTLTPAAPAQHAHAPAAPQAAAAAYAPRFFSPHEWKTANLLADMIIPKDDRSPGAAEVGAMEYVDEYAVFRGEGLQTLLRGGLTWLDRECSRRFDTNFVESSEAQRKEVLDLIAHPEKETPEYSQAIRFFNTFRDLTASGFYTTRAGIDDLGFMGNRPHDWKGCPDEVLVKLGLK